MSDVVETEVVETEGATDTTTPDAEGSKTAENLLTQAQVDEIVKERLARERKKLNDERKSEESKKDAEGLTEIQKLQKELEDLRKENASTKLTALRNEVSTETGVPVSLLTAEDAESLKAQAEAIREFAKSQTPETRTNTTPKENLKSGNSSDNSDLSRDEILARVNKMR